MAKKDFKRETLNRINYLTGHLEGVKRMIEEDKYCIDVIKQNEAVIAAIKKLNHLILENHLHTCVSDAIKGNDTKERRKKIQELVEIFNNSD